MKAQAVVILAILFLLANLVTDSHGISGPIPGKKRELERKVCIAPRSFDKHKRFEAGQRNFKKRDFKFLASGKAATESETD